jgi:hypothetical protein
MGDLWALKGLFDEEKEPPAWTQLKLPGSAPASRCGHSTTSGGSQLLIFGGHGTGGWLTRYDIYHNDSMVLDRGRFALSFHVLCLFDLQNSLHFSFKI